MSTAEERAAFFKDRIKEALAPTIHLLEQAKTEGFQINFDIGQENDRTVLKNIRVLKEL